MSEQKKRLSRREALKLLGTATGASLLANLPSKWSKPRIAGGEMPAHAQISPVLPTVRTVSITPEPGLFVTFNGYLGDEGFPAPVTDTGFVIATFPTIPTLPGTSFSAGVVPVGPFDFGPTNSGINFGNYYGRAYATNAAGTAYGDPIEFQTLCLAEGTLITLADGTTKKIEDIEYSDLLLVWNFDEGRFDEAKSLWIKKTETAFQYNLIEFSDGSFIKTIHDHRIFNKEKGMFTYPMISDDAPIGTTTFNANGEEVTLVKKSVVNDKVDFYNIITDRHMNLFANGNLTSCRYNNIYPIVGMKFVKDDRELIPQSAYGVEDKYYEGLRLAEQTVPVEDTIEYVNRLEAHKVEVESEIEFA